MPKTSKTNKGSSQDSLKELLRSAENGDIKSKIRLADYFLENRCDSKQKDQIINWLMTIVENGDVDAQYKLGCCYLKWYKSSDYRNKGLLCITEAAEKGNAEAQYRLAMHYMGKHNNPLSDRRPKIIDLLTKAAESGMIEAQYQLAWCLNMWHKTKKHRKQAIYWWEKLANEGHAQAQFDLGVAYWNGEGVEQNYEKSFYWNLKAAESGLLEAQYQVGVGYMFGDIVEVNPAPYCGFTYTPTYISPSNVVVVYCGPCHRKTGYLRGNYTPIDPEKAIYWLTLAAEAGHLKAQCLLAYSYLRLQEIPKDRKKAFYWAYKAAEKEVSEFQYFIAQCYMKGEVCEKDPEIAVFWYSKAADHMVKEAIYKLAKCYMEGIGVNKDVDKAISLYSRATDSGDEPAIMELASFYQNGIGVEKNLVKAAVLWGKVARRNEEARKLLDKFYSNGVDAGIVESTDDTEYIDPQVSNLNSTSLIQIKKVIIKSSETIIEMMSYVSDVSKLCPLPVDTFIIADGVEYPLTCAYIVVGGREFPLRKTEGINRTNLSLVLHFPPIPKSIKVFDLIDKGTDGWLVKGIEVNRCEKYLIESEGIPYSFRTWRCDTINLHDNQTILTKTVIICPDIHNKSIHSDSGSFIEDADTGCRYNVLKCSISSDESSKILPPKESYTYYEIYPALPLHVKNINIGNANFYYFRNLKIR